MNIETMLYEIVSQQIGRDFDAADIADGIKAYVKNEKLEDFLNRFPEEMRFAALKMYMSPILNGKIISYFRDYIAYFEFDKLSKEAFELAKAKKNGQEVDSAAVDELEKAFCEAYAQLSKDYRSKSRSFNSLVSDVLLDLQYAKGEAKRMSFRLMHSGV